MRKQQGSSSTLRSNGSEPEAKIVRKETHESTQGAPIPIATNGEIFADGTAIELVQQIGEPERTSLLYWDGVRGTIAPIAWSVKADLTYQRGSTPASCAN
jgi:hypothetical protein